MVRARLFFVKTDFGVGVSGFCADFGLYACGKATPSSPLPEERMAWVSGRRRKTHACLAVALVSKYDFSFRSLRGGLARDGWACSPEPGIQHAAHAFAGTLFVTPAAGCRQVGYYEYSLLVFVHFNP